MKVYKFGGASVANVELVKNVANIVAKESNDLVIIISAMGKTTNALEKVVEAFYKNEAEQAITLFNQIKNQHLQIAKYLLVTEYIACESQLKDFFTEIEWLLHDKPVKSYDYYYDQIVCVGELMSTSIVSHYFTEVQIQNTWADVRDIVRTDNNFREGIVDIDYTTQQIIAAKNNAKILLTQGFIGATDENESTTLGREGSDYTAALFANMLQAESLTIWKDVEGVMSADPKQFPEAIYLQQLSFEEVIEMAYYGAQVIHPKTIKPLQNKGIPLLVKCYLNDALPGTIIENKRVKNLPPIIIKKDQQVLLELSSKDFSFVGEALLGKLYQLMEEKKIKPNLVQTGAIKIWVCLNDNEEKINTLAIEAANYFEVNITKQLHLLTVRNYTEQVIEQHTRTAQIILVQKTIDTYQALYQIQ